MNGARDLGTLLRALAARHGTKPAVRGETAALSLAELDRAADAWADGLIGAGYGPGSRIGLLAANRPEWLAVAFGVWRAGASLVPVSTFASARELAETLDGGDVELLLLQPRLGSRDYVGLLREHPTPPRLREVAALGGGVPSLADASSFARRSGAARPDVDPESIACVLHTSGTTGRSKGVMLSHRAVLSTIGPTAARSGLDSSDSLLSTLPLFWVAGLVIRALPTLAAGCALDLLAVFSAEAVLASMRRNRPTALHLRPPQVGQLLAHREFDPALLSEVRKGNGRVEWFAPHLDPDRTRFITGYGMTEMAGYVTALDWRDPVDPGIVHLGRPLPGVELEIVGKTDEPAPPGQAGEVRVRGPGMFSGYCREVAGTGIDARGFFATGDLGYLDGEGRLRFVGRLKDLLRVKGINVSPIEVEEVLAAHPSVEAAYVVGLPADGLDQRVVALLVMRDDGELAETELRALAAAELSPYKRPERYLVVRRPEVPLGATSKPQRAALAELAERRLRSPASA